jgi:hypothetical protein
VAMTNGLVIIDIETVSEQVHISTNRAIRNILNIVEAAFGNKLDDKQQRMVRKVVLDEINDLKNMFIVLYQNGESNGEMRK